ncbi:MAG: hypothetical protein KDB27_18215 [Planctomycetales bacterium]|nr:hypothetical protein [Planctomycetales bacterium]
MCWQIRCARISVSCLFCFTFLLSHAAFAQLQIDFSRAPDDEPLQDGWLPFQSDDVFASEAFDFNGSSIEVTVEGNTHWRDYAEATRGFEPWSDLLRDGVLCNAACDMALTIDGLPDGNYDLRAYLHTTQFGESDGRPFTPFEISMRDSSGTSTVNDDAFMSDNGSDELSTQLFSFSIQNGSPFVAMFSKFEGTDHMQVSGFELATSGSLNPPPKINHPEPPAQLVIDFPDGLKVDLSRDPDEFPLQDGWAGMFGEFTDGTTESFAFDGREVEVTIEGNTHWRDYRAAAEPFDGYSDLLSDGPLCNDACLMTVTIEGLADGDYEFLSINHTTQFGDQDGRPFTEFEIRLTDANGDDQLINDTALMSDDSSDEVSMEAIPFTVSNGSAIQIIYEKFGGNDHMALAGFVISSAGGIDGDFDGSGKLDAADIDLLTEEIRKGSNSPSFDLSNDGAVNDADLEFWVKTLHNSWIGDANLDNEFNSSDFVTVFGAGKYEKEVDAGWADGDWNGDGRFDSGDFVVAFRDGGYEQGPRPPIAAVPEPASGTLAFIAVLAPPLMLRKSKVR